MTDALRLGTRRSALALAQSRQVAAALGSVPRPPVELVEITTLGDTSRAAVTELGGTGVFVGALREALYEYEIDVAVHSYKDLPTAVADGLTIAAVPPRGDPRDALVARDGLTLGELPHGSRVGTGSPRRAAQLRALGLGLEVVPVRGNVDTRLKYVIDGELDAVVLACAGLERLGRLDDVTEVIDPIQMLPAPAQGALAVECRRPTRTSETGRAGGPRNGGDDAITVKILTALDDPDTRAAVEAERALLAALEAGCTAPVGALAEVAETDLSSAVDAADRDQAGHGRTMDQAEFSTEIYLRAVVVSADGTASIRMSKTGPSHDAVGLGRQLAAEMLAEGAATLLGPSLISERHP